MDDNLDQRPLRLLSLDGGGIRGLSSLIILKSIMVTVHNKKTQTTTGPFYPFEYFDLIAGTSTGGLIAVMLGVLHMDVDTCINEYITMASKIFPVEGTFSGSKLGKLIKVAKGNQRFNPAALETLIKKLVADHLKTRSSDGESTTLRFEATDQQCKVFVCVTSEKLNKHFRFRSYEDSRNVIDDCMIWEACRATSAAPTFFPPMMIGNPPIAYIDGGLGYNNPIRPLMDEAGTIWPGRKIGCIVSIGTGVPECKDVGRTIRPLFETLAAMSVDTENVAREFKEEMESKNPNCKLYFRFNVQHELEQVSLEEWKEFDRTKVATHDYLNDHWKEVDLCATQICTPSDGTSCIAKAGRVARLSTVPFSQDPKLIKRNDIMTKLDSILNRPGHNRAALIGFGGIGKSQIAIEYSYRIKTDDTWVFWVYASNTNRIEQSFRRIAEKSNLPGHNDPTADIIHSVSLWLEDERNGAWLMILDNADDSEIFTQLRSHKAYPDSNMADLTRSLLSLIPQKPWGKVLITSRDRNTAFNLVGDFDNIVKVDPMNESDSLSLLRTKLSIDPVMENDAIELLDTLEHIPLAITQAGAYIRQLEPLMTLAKYLQEFRKNKSNQTTLLNRNAQDLRRDDTVSNSIIVTWEISFNQISQRYESAADLLSLMSLFHRQSIPEILIRKAGDDDDLAFLERINPLIDFSLISVESGEKSYGMHRLVQVATRKWLEANQLLQKWETKTIERIAMTFPDGKYENWETCEKLLPHAEEIISYEPLDNKTKLQYASLLNHTAWYISERGNSELAMKRCEQCLKIRSQVLDKEDDDVLSAMHNLALMYTVQGQWEDAEKLNGQVLNTRLKALGAEHPHTLISMSNLTNVFNKQGLKEAEKLNLQVMNTRLKILGAEHSKTLTSMNNLAITFGKQGRWKEAEKLNLQVMNTRLKVLGAEHPDTLTIMSNLASTFVKQGRLKKAEKLNLQVMNTRLKVLGVANEDTLISMKFLAYIYKIQNRDDEATELMKSVVSPFGKVLGPTHPETLDAVHSLTHWT